MVDLGLYHPWYHDAPALHISIGAITVSVMILRYFWRRMNPIPEMVDQPALLKLIASTVHQLFYPLVVALGVSGYMISTAEGDPLLIFEELSIPSIHFGIDNQADLAGEIHLWLAWTLIGLAVLHALAALKHHVINHDTTLTRMIFSNPKKEHDHE